MAYQDDGALYRDPMFRIRSEMCIREQGYIFSNDLDPEISGLGRGVVSGNNVDIDAIIAAIVVASETETLTEDGPLLNATKAVWPVVASALYPEGSPAT